MRGAEFGLADCGMRAVLNSMRLEKGYLMGADFSEATPLQTGLEPFVNWEKDFIGRKALLAQKEKGIQNRIVMLDISASDADAYGDECIWSGNTGSRAHHLRRLGTSPAEEPGFRIRPERSCGARHRAARGNYG